VPLSLTRIPVSSDATIFPRQAILLIHVSKDGTTLERACSDLNLDTFNNQALDMAKPCAGTRQKNGEPVDALGPVEFPAGEAVTINIHPTAFIAPARSAGTSPWPHASVWYGACFAGHGAS